MFKFSSGKYRKQLKTRRTITPQPQPHSGTDQRIYNRQTLKKSHQQSTFQTFFFFFWPELSEPKPFCCDKTNTLKFQ